MAAPVLAKPGKGQERKQQMMELKLERKALKAELKSAKMLQKGPKINQGAVKCLLVIDYTVPGSGVPEGTPPSGTMTLTASRGSVTNTFEALIPWGLTNEEAFQLILETFGPIVYDSFGLLVNSFRVLSYSFDEETSVTTISFCAIHGKAPVSLDAIFGEEGPGRPEEPVDPQDPVDPDNPEDPENPQTPGDPENPEGPEDPVYPDNPETPEEGTE